jgi:uncharacterized protein (TIGR03382 family)
MTAAQGTVIMKNLLSGLVLGASLLSGVAFADAPFIASFPVHDDMHAGALWKNNNPNNYDQRGAGCEHHSVVYLKATNSMLMTCTGSYTDVTPAITSGGQLSSQAAGVLPPADDDGTGIGVQEGNNNHRVEGLCAAYSLDATAGLKQNNMAYISSNNSDEWKNFHKPQFYAVDGGNAALVVYGYQPQGTNNTVTYGRVIGPNCELLSAQTELVAKTNDNVGGLYEGGFAVDNADGSSDAIFGMIGNGNGDDNGWIAKAHVTKTGTGATTYTVKKTFDQTVVQNEERSRGTIMQTTDANHILVIYAEGDNQPPDNGVRMSYVNTADTAPAGTNTENAAGGRIEWRQYLMQRAGKIYYSTPSLTKVPDASGNPTDTYLANWVKVDTTNRNNNRQKGSTLIQSSVVQISTTGIASMSTPQAGLFGLADGAHPGLVEGTYGQNNRPVAFMFQGSITDGGTATLKIYGAAADGQSLEPVRALTWAPTTSGGFTSQWYGENPNTPQGRSYPPHGILVANPGYGQASGYQSTVKQFLLVAHGHHMDHTGTDPSTGGCVQVAAKGTNDGTCGGKNATSLVLIPVSADPASTTPVQGNDPTPTNSGDPDDPTAPPATSTLGGCSTSGSGGAGTLILLGLAVASTIRRRQK